MLTFTIAPEYQDNVFASLNGGEQNLAVRQQDGRYAVQINGIAAHLLGEPQNVTVSTGAENDFNIQVSALTFVYNTLRNTSTAIDRQKLAAALYNYHQATIAYQKSH